MAKKPRMAVEGISKPMTLGNLMRSAHAFGASFFFGLLGYARDVTGDVAIFHELIGVPILEFAQALDTLAGGGRAPGQETRENHRGDERKGKTNYKYHG